MSLITYSNSINSVVMAVSSPFQNKSEVRKFIRILSVTVFVFMCVATTQMLLFNGHLHLRIYILPVIFSLVVGSAFGWNAILRSRLIASNRVKSDFISLISHEIRTPLTVINGFSRILAEASNLEEREQDYARRIYYSGEHLLTVINDMLDISAIESGKVNVEMSSVEITGLLRDCCYMMKSLTEKTGIKLIENLGKDNVFVFADPIRLKQIVLNLVSNAIKYNKQNGHVEISLEDINQEFYRLNIRDDGYGIPDDKRDLIFRPFERLERDKSSVRGTGLGLAITKKLVHMMGGDIGYVSQPGVGSTFWVDIRKSQAEHL